MSLLSETHPFTDSGDGTCLTCGVACDPFGLRSEPAFPEPLQDRDEAPICNGAGGCWHMRHDGPCRVSLSPVRSVPCPCTEHAA